MQTSGTLQELIELSTAEVRKMSPEQKAEFRAPWLAYVTEKENRKQNDRRFLRSVGMPGRRRLMVRVEVIVQDGWEFYNIPSIPNLTWQDQNILALQEVYDLLKVRGLCLDGLEMYAWNLEFRSEWNTGR